MRSSTLSTARRCCATPPRWRRGAATTSSARCSSASRAASTAMSPPCATPSSRSARDRTTPSPRRSRTSPAVSGTASPRAAARSASGSTAGPARAERTRRSWGRVRQDRRGDRVVVGGMEHVPGAVQDEQAGARDLARERLAVAEREQRVGAAVDDERRDDDGAEAVAPRRAAVEQRMVLRVRGAARAGDVALDERADARLVERAVRGERADVGDDVVDDRARVRPVDGAAGEERGVVLGDRRQVAARARRRGAQEHERRDALGMVEGEELRQGAPHRAADDVGARDAVAVEDARGVGDEVGAPVVRAPRRADGRAAGVAVVVADDEAAAGGERGAERLVPPEHRGAAPHDQQHRRVAGSAEGLGAQLDAADVDHPLRHGASLGSFRFRLARSHPDFVDVPSFDDPHGIAVALAATVALLALGLLVWFVIWPLLALATELAVVATIAVAGAVARVFFGRPWVIEAVGAGTERRWQVRDMAAGGTASYE